MVRLPSIPHIELVSVNKSKYCQFNRRHGHNTDEYYTLKWEIEVHIQSRELKGFIHWYKVVGGNVRTRRSNGHAPNSPEKEMSNQKGRHGDPRKKAGHKCYLWILEVQWGRKIIHRLSCRPRKDNGGNALFSLTKICWLGEAPMCKP